MAEINIEVSCDKCGDTLNEKGTTTDRNGTLYISVSLCNACLVSLEETIRAEYNEDK